MRFCERAFKKGFGKEKREGEGRNGTLSGTTLLHTTRWEGSVLERV